MTNFDDDQPLVSTGTGYNTGQSSKKGGLPSWVFLLVGVLLVLAVVIVLGLTVFGGKKRAPEQQAVVMVDDDDTGAASSPAASKKNIANPAGGVPAAGMAPAGASRENAADGGATQMGMHQGQSVAPPPAFPEGMSGMSGMSGQGVAAVGGPAPSPAPAQSVMPPQGPLATSNDLQAATERIQKLETQLQQVSNQLQQVDAQMQQVVRALYVQPKIMTGRARKGAEGGLALDNGAVAGMRQDPAAAEEESEKQAVYNTKYELVAIIGDRAWLRSTGSTDVREYAVAKGDLIAGSRVAEINVPGKYIALKNGQRIR